MLCAPELRQLLLYTFIWYPLALPWCPKCLTQHFVHRKLFPAAMKRNQTRASNYCALLVFDNIFVIDPQELSITCGFMQDAIICVCKGKTLDHLPNEIVQMNGTERRQYIQKTKSLHQIKNHEQMDELTNTQTNKQASKQETNPFFEKINAYTQ